MDKTVRLRISGFVQGVGYRDWSRRGARRLGLAGWVRNRADGSVEVLVSGSADAVETFIESAKRGPRSARVDRVDQTPDVTPTGSGFDVLPTE